MTDAEIQAYYTPHAAEYKTEEQVKTRHILITSEDRRGCATDAAAKAKAQDVLKQVQAGGNFADLAKKYSEDPGSKDHRRRTAADADGAASIPPMPRLRWLSTRDRPRGW